MTFGDPEYPCAVPVERCWNKQKNAWICHGSLIEECYVNWLSADPEDLEPYEDYVAVCHAKKENT